MNKKLGKFIKWWFRYFVFSYTIYGATTNLLEITETALRRSTGELSDDEVTYELVLISSIRNLKKWIKLIKRFIVEKRRLV